MDTATTNDSQFPNVGSIITVALVFPISAIFVVSGRIASRAIRHAGFSYDDYLASLATACLVGTSVALLVGVAAGAVGYHTPPSIDAFNPKGVILSKVQYVVFSIWLFGVAAAKLSFCFFYRRIFRGKVFTIVNTALMVLVGVCPVVFFLVNTFTCGRHVDDLWGQTAEVFNPECPINGPAVLVANAATSLFCDVALVIIPIPLVWQLHANARTKVTCTALFGLAGLCVTASALRLVIETEIWHSLVTGDFTASLMGVAGADEFGIFSLDMFWSQFELGIAAVACNLPTLGPLLDTPAGQALSKTISSVSLRLHTSRGSETRLGHTEKGKAQSRSESVSHAPKAAV